LKLASFEAILKLVHLKASSLKASFETIFKLVQLELVLKLDFKVSSLEASFKVA